VAVRDVAPLPKRCPNARDTPHGGKRLERSRTLEISCTLATSRRSAAPETRVLEESGGLEVPSSNLGAPIGFVARSAILNVLSASKRLVFGVERVQLVALVVGRIRQEVAVVLVDLLHAGAHPPRQHE
jgi:hypothetical protein